MEPRWGILGCGKIASDFANALELAGSHLVAVAARDEVLQSCRIHAGPGECVSLRFD